MIDRIKVVAVDLNQKYAFEIIDQLTRERIKSELKYALGPGVEVVCDETNNPNDVIDQQMVRALIIWDRDKDGISGYKYCEIMFGSRTQTQILEKSTVSDVKSPVIDAEKSDSTFFVEPSYLEKSILIYYVNVGQVSPESVRRKIAAAMESFYVDGVETKFIPINGNSRVEHHILRVPVRRD